MHEFDMEDAFEAATPPEYLRPEELQTMYLAASYAYYVRGKSLTSDVYFDQICKYLLDNRLFCKTVTEDNLRAGTCLGVRYPQGIKDLVDVTAESLEAEDNPTEEQTLACAFAAESLDDPLNDNPLLPLQWLVASHVYDDETVVICRGDPEGGGMDRKTAEMIADALVEKFST